MIEPRRGIRCPKGADRSKQMHPPLSGAATSVGGRCRLRDAHPQGRAEIEQSQGCFSPIFRMYRPFTSSHKLLSEPRARRAANAGFWESGHPKAMLWTIGLMLSVILPRFGERAEVRKSFAIECLVLHQQLAVYSQEKSRPPLNGGFRMFWVMLHHLWPRWKEVCVFVEPATVIAWHRAGFRR